MWDHVTPPVLALVASVATVVAGAIAAVDVQVDAGFVTAAGTLIIALAGAMTKMWRSQMAQAAELGRLRAAVEACRQRDEEYRVARDESRAERADLRHQIDELRNELARQHGDGR